MNILDWVAQAGISVSVGDIGIVILLILSLVEITPIKLNPWSKMAKWFGKMMSTETMTEITKIDSKVQELGQKIDKVGKDLDALDGQVKDLMQEVQNNESKEEEREVINARIRILEFCDELQEGRKHSKDRFDQVMTDITLYNQYCADHKDFKNNQTESTVEYIIECYKERLEKHDFM